MSRCCTTRVIGALSVAIVLSPSDAGASPSCLHRRTCDAPIIRGDAITAAPRPTLRVAPPVAGRVQNESGQPLPNVDVIVTEVGRTTTTGADGTFEVRGLAAGTYHFNFLSIGYSPRHVAVTLPDSGPTVTVTVTMRRATVRLQAVQVTATPTGTDPLSITQSTAELSGRALSRNLGASVAQTLSNEPGLAMRYNGPAAAVPVIRGLTGERILVLQDGQRAGDLASSSSDHALSLDPLTAQRIEVVRGPASLLYGNNALGGVVNVISNDIPNSIPTHHEGYVAGHGESVNPGGALSAGLVLPLFERFAVSGRVNMRSLEDFRAGGDVRQLNTYSRNQGYVLGLGHVGADANGGIAFRGRRFNYGLPAPSGEQHAGAHIEGRRDEGTVRFDQNVSARAIETIRVDGTVQSYQHDEIENTGEIGTRFKLRTQTANVTARTLWAPNFKGAIGLSGLLKQYASTGEEALTPGANSSSGGVFVYQEIPIGRVLDDTTAEGRRPHLQIGARYDLYRIRADADEGKFGPARSATFTNASGSFGASTPLGRNMTLSGSVARAFRAPTVEELYSNGFHAAVGTYDVGNPDLKAEVNSGVDGVLRAQSGRTSGQISAYYNRITDYISPNIVRDTIVEESDVVPLNVYAQQDATLRGVEGQLEAEVARHVVVGAVADMVRGRFTSGASLPFMPSARVGASLRWDTGQFFAGGDVRHGFAQERVSQAQCARADLVTIGSDGELPVEPHSGAPCVDVATPAYTVVNLNGGFTWIMGAASHSLTLRADNVGDTRYFDASSRIKSFTANPGRNFSLVYRLSY